VITCASASVCLRLTPQARCQRHVNATIGPHDLQPTAPHPTLLPQAPCLLSPRDNQTSPSYTPRAAPSGAATHLRDLRSHTIENLLVEHDRVRSGGNEGEGARGQRPTPREAAPRHAPRRGQCLRRARAVQGNSQLLSVLALGPLLQKAKEGGGKFEKGPRVLWPPILLASKGGAASRATLPVQATINKPSRPGACAHPHTPRSERAPVQCSPSAWTCRRSSRRASSPPST